MKKTLLRFLYNPIFKEIRVAFIRRPHSKHHQEKSTGPLVKHVKRALFNNRIKMPFAMNMVSFHT